MTAGLKKLGIPSIEDFVPLSKPAPASDEDLKKYLLNHSYRDELELPADEDVLYYNGIPIGSRGNIVAINGRAKSRKSVIASAMMSAAFSSGFLGFTVKISGAARVLHFDTEQGYGHWLRGSRRVIKDAGLTVKPAGYFSHHSRDSNAEERIELIRVALDMYKPDIAVIDGVTDLVYDLNSQEAATKIGETLMQWSVKYNCVVVVVIHVTKTSGFMTGAVGTYLEKKCQTALTCEKDDKDDRITWVHCQYARDESFNPFGIEFNSGEGRYIRLNETEVAQRGPGANNGPETKSEDFKLQFLNAVFRIHSSFLTESDFKKIGIFRAGTTSGLGELKPKDLKAWAEYFKEAQLVEIQPDGSIHKAEVLRAARAQAPGINFEAPPEDNPADDLPF